MTGGTEEDAAPIDAMVCGCHDKHTKTVAPCYLCREQTGHEQCWLCRKTEPLAEEDAIEPSLQEFHALLVEYRQDIQVDIVDANVKAFGRYESLLAETREKSERSGMAWVHATVLELTDDTKLIRKLDKLVQQRLAALGGKSDK